MFIWPNVSIFLYQISVGQVSLEPLILMNSTLLRHIQDLKSLNSYGEHRFINEKYVKSGHGDNSEFSEFFAEQFLMLFCLSAMQFSS